MAITDKNTVLILGAGTSAPFGLPLGGQLISNIHSALHKEIQYLEKDYHYFESRLRTVASNSNEFWKAPIHGSIASQHLANQKFNAVQVNLKLPLLRQLIERLDNQTSETIDDFIVENPSLSSITKVAIASEFMKCIFTITENRNVVRNFDSRNFKKMRNWVHLLINMIRQGIRRGSVDEKNKVKIITFNYDCILEYVLEKQFSNTEANYQHYSNYIEIIHPHGICGNLEAKVTHPQQLCLEWANGIHVINEPEVPEDIRKAREIAKGWVNDANELCFCGFAFAGPNLEMLGLGKYKCQARQIIAHNYDGNVGLNRIANKFTDQKFRTVEINDASPEKPMQISDWIRIGYLGEMPG